MLKMTFAMTLIFSTQCFASITKNNINAIKITKDTLTTNKPHHHFQKDAIHSVSRRKQEQLTISILEFIKKHTDPYKKKNEAQDSWIKSTISIKAPSWTKKEIT